MKQFGIALACLFLLVMTYAWQHFKAIEYGYKIEALKMQKDSLTEMNRALLLEEASLESFDVVVGATGDDKVNLVVSLLAKTEFAVNRVVARINHPANEWLFTEAWGVDTAVSTPRVLASLVEEAVEVGDIVRLFGIREGQANLVELTLPEDAPCAGSAVRELTLPKDATLVAIVRGRRVITPTPEEPLEAGDELLFVALPETEDRLRRAVLPS